MTRPVRAILIDPFACTVSDVETDADDYRDLYRLLSHPTMPVELFDRCYFDGIAGNDALFFDDEGLLKPCVRFFRLVTKPDGRPLTGYLAGKGIIVGADDEGDTAAAVTPLAYVAERAKFLHHVGNGRLFKTRLPLTERQAEQLPPAVIDAPDFQYWGNLDR